MSDNRPTRFTQTPRPPKLLDQVRQGIRLKHMSSRTEDSYVHYIRQFILFHNKRHHVAGPQSTTRVQKTLNTCVYLRLKYPLLSKIACGRVKCKDSPIFWDRPVAVMGIVSEV
jgi:hypothetical protein